MQLNGKPSEKERKRQPEKKNVNKIEIWRFLLNCFVELILKKLKMLHRLVGSTRRTGIMHEPLVSN